MTISLDTSASSGAVAVLTRIPGGSILLAGYLTLAGSSYGITDANGNKVLPVDSVIGVDYRNSSEVTDYPMEPNAFQSVNKVQSPFDVRALLGIGGLLANRSAILSTLDSLVTSASVCNLQTPERTYSQITLVGYSVRKTATEGVSFLTIDTSWRQIRQTAVTTYSNTANPNDAATVSNGTVSTTTTDSGVVASSVPTASITQTAIH